MINNCTAIYTAGIQRHPAADHGGRPETASRHCHELHCATLQIQQEHVRALEGQQPPLQHAEHSVQVNTSSPALTAMLLPNPTHRYMCYNLDGARELLVQ